MVGTRCAATWPAELAVVVRAAVDGLLVGDWAACATAR